MRTEGVRTIRDHDHFVIQPAGCADPPQRIRVFPDRLIWRRAQLGWCGHSCGGGLYKQYGCTYR
jgi:hypothetical protein